MLRPDVIDLREFYASALGQTARRILRGRMRAIWPSLKGQRVLGLGYAAPYLGLFRDEAERVAAAMPAHQGVVRWPVSGPSLVTLAEETELPFPDAMFDRLLMVHSLENAENARALLREAWRVLTASGRLLIVAPNRRGLWARFEHTPFGQGHPYTPRQLSRLMRDNLFSPTESSAALYLPPSQRRTVLRAANAFENAGRRFWPHFSGVVLLEAEKQIYVAIPAKAAARAQARLARQNPASASRA
jgi:SAM-dependent methyltransferase